MRTSSEALRDRGAPRHRDLLVDCASECLFVEYELVFISSMFVSWRKCLGYLDDYPVTRRLFDVAKQGGCSRYVLLTPVTLSS